MTEKTWISSCSAILVGLSFLLTALVQVTLHYYSTTLNEVNLFVKIVICIAIFLIGIFMADKIFSPLLTNIQQNIPAGLSKWYQNILKIGLVILIVSIVSLIFFSSPKAILKYQFICPIQLSDSSEIMLYVWNDGPIYGKYKFLSNSKNENISFMFNNKIIKDWTGLVIPPHTEQIYHSIYVFSIKDPKPKNFTINNNFECSMLDCEIIKILNTYNECFYEDKNRSGIYYLTKQ